GRIVLHLQQRGCRRRPHGRRQPHGQRRRSDDAVLRLCEDARRAHRAGVPLRAHARRTVRGDLQPAELLDGADGERDGRAELLHPGHHRAGTAIPVRRSRGLVMARFGGDMRVALAALWFSIAAAPAFAGAPTFSKDVAPIVYKHCVECHRPTAMAPMSLLTYEDARPWARAIKQKVVAKQMPPWGADPAIGRFSNDGSLTQTEVAPIAAWVDSGAAEGNRAERPKAPQFAEGWSIGKPDYVFRMQKPFTVPADGTVPYVYITIPTNLKEDIWIKAVELKPTDRRVVHHIISTLVEGSGMAPDPEPKLTRDPARKEIGGGLGGLVPGRLYREVDEG